MGKQRAISSLLAAGALLIAAGGCQQMPPALSIAPSGYALAGPANETYLPHAEESHSPFWTTAGPEEAAAIQPASPPPGPTTAPAASLPSTQPATQPIRRAYTAPSVPFQQLTIAAAVTQIGAVPELIGGGREISESVSLGAQGVGGRSGVAGPSPVVQNTVASRSGIQRGEAGGLGFASPVRNIFRAGANPASGPGGRCTELTGLGFFGGSPLACEAGFRRSPSARIRK